MSPFCVTSQLVYCSDFVNVIRGSHSCACATYFLMGCDAVRFGRQVSEKLAASIFSVEEDAYVMYVSEGSGFCPDIANYVPKCTVVHYGLYTHSQPLKFCCMPRGTRSRPL